jgi:carbon monoxide dehydrogenase subunit G
MSISIERVFEVNRPIEEVWRFLTDAGRIAECLPGARLLEIIDDRTFLGEVALRLGPLGTTLRGTARFEAMDPALYEVEMAAEGAELSGSGSAEMRMFSRLAAVEGARTRVEVEQIFLLSGRFALFIASSLLARGVEFVFGRFAACVKSRLESPQEGGWQA